MEKKIKCSWCAKQNLVIDIDKDSEFRGDYVCSGCRCWNKLTGDLEVSKGAHGATDEYREDLNIHYCRHCDTEMIRYKSNSPVYFKISCYRCSVINTYPLEDFQKIKKTGHNISRYLREQRTLKKLISKKQP